MDTPADTTGPPTESVACTMATTPPSAEPDPPADEAEVHLADLVDECLRAERARPGSSAAIIHIAPEQVSLSAGGGAGTPAHGRHGIRRSERGGRPGVGQAGPSHRGFVSREHGRPAAPIRRGARQPVTEALAKDAPSAACAEDPFIATLVDRAVATRDPAAFGLIFDHFGQQIYRYLYVRRENHADAEDLTQQVFLNAWESIGRFRWQGRPFVAWLYRLAHNAYVDHVRRQCPAVSLEHAIPLMQQVSTASSGDVTGLLDADVLAAAVRQLTRKQRQVIHLRFIADLDTCEIAKIMGEREGAIRALQMRALMRLRLVLEVRAVAPAAKPPETRSTLAMAGAPARVRPRDANAREVAPTAALAHTERGPSGARARLRAGGATLGRFRIRFLAERVVQARDIQDALRQANAFEAIEVIAIMHED